MADQEQIDERRVQVALRLKAARHLVGRAEVRKGKRRTKRAVPMRIDELAQLPELRDNQITRNRLEQIEQMETDARPMELEKIALALNLPLDWFLTPREEASLRAFDRLRSALAGGEEEEAPQARGERGRADGLEGRRGRAAEGAS